MKQGSGHSHLSAQTTWLAFVFADLNSKPASLLDLDNAFAVAATQPIPGDRYGIMASSCSTCTAHIKGWKVTKMEAEIQQMKRLSSFL